MQTAIPNEMILASAGSGKTWQLTNRFIALMAQQHLAEKKVEPERIIAVTFTRKAAGEFFDAILIKLANAASQPGYASKLVGDVAIDPEAANDPLRPLLSRLTQKDYSVLLRAFIAAMPRLFLGTLDSFFASILRAFPAEFGLVGDFEILDDHQGSVEREKVYRSAFRRSLPSLNARSEAVTDQKDFLEAFRRATFGREVATIRTTLDEYVDNLHGIFLHAADESLWGNAERIWPKGTQWLNPPLDLEKDLSRLWALFAKANLADKQMEFWDEFKTELLKHQSGNALPKRVAFFLEKLLQVWSDVERGACEIVVNRLKQKLEGEACTIVADVIRHIVGGELRVRLQRTQGVAAVLNAYEQNWSRQVRRLGRLTFQDMELILAGHEFGHRMPKRMLSQVPSEDARLRIDYRLDSRYDHWLLDEFQDTNHVQWAVVQNLIDEVVQDNSDERSLFQVGDIKQAIYAWRGGDITLFDQILRHYNGSGTERITTRPLNVSWRSGHDVIEIVNRIFGDKDVLRELDLPEEVINKWQWQDHSVAGIHQKMPGYCAMLNPLPEDGEKVTEEDRFQLVAGILEEIQPVKNGLSCAILVQENRRGRALVDYLRTHSPSRIPVMSESEISVATDNPLTLALLSLLKCAAHPGDTLAWEHLCMTPFQHVFEKKGILFAGKLSSEVLKQVFDLGFEATLRFWVKALQSHGTSLDAFSLGRMEDFALAARLFDASGSRSVDEFIAYASSFTTKEPDTRNAVQVMTIHKSKGLTFDCVILPDLEGDKLISVRRGIGVKRDAKHEVKWVFDLPPSEIVRADDELKAYREEREVEAAYEELCKFYVALTRARQANYLVTSPRSSKSTSNNFIRLLQLALGDEGEPVDGEFGEVAAKVVYESSTEVTNRRWFETKKPQKELQTSKQPIAVPQMHGRVRPSRRTPSGSEAGYVTGAQLFSRHGRKARSYGTLVHAFFEQIEWLDTTSTDTLETAWNALPGAGDEVHKRAHAEVTRCLDFDAVRQLLSRPSVDAVCWREKRFEILLHGEWLSGTFDRVVLEKDKALILDFKTDNVPDEVALQARIETYRPQLETYRHVLVRMTGLPASAVRCALLFTQSGRICEL